VPPATGLDPLDPRDDPLLDGLAVGAVLRDAEFGDGGSRKSRTEPRRAPTRSSPSAKRRAGASLRKARRVRRRAPAISIDLESQTVQVTTDAKASPISTAFTSGSALRNMPQGVRSRSSARPPVAPEAASGAPSGCAHAPPM
jgi:hypothetical protein